MLIQRIYQWFTLSRAGENLTGLVAGAGLVTLDYPLARFLLCIGVAVWFGSSVILDGIDPRETP